MKANTLTSTSTMLIILCGIGLLICMFVPIWWIGLEAPQYPEGLEMTLWANKITGDLNRINPLNHYIGMKAIHPDDFWEFGVMRYILAFFAVFCIAVALLKKRGLLYALTVCFLLFGIAFVIDFWWWEYQYGHDLDPTAAIQIEGMTYQPPLIGSKQLLNFYAQSYPSWGGSIMLVVGFVLTLLSVSEFKKSKKEY